jgi:anti-sigma regulatory factor (Ser/Thr protein kinase)
MARWRGTFPATPGSVGILRGEMAAIARECGLPDERVADVMLAVSEAATNVIVHAYPDHKGLVSGAAFVGQGALRIVIADNGVGMAPRIDSPGLGLGLPMVATVADALDVKTSGDGTEIEMTFPCPAAA